MTVCLMQHSCQMPRAPLLECTHRHPFSFQSPMVLTHELHMELSATVEAIGRKLPLYERPAFMCHDVDDVSVGHDRNPDAVRVLPPQHQQPAEG